MTTKAKKKVAVKLPEAGTSTVLYARRSCDYSYGGGIEVCGQVKTSFFPCVDEDVSNLNANMFKSIFGFVPAAGKEYALALTIEGVNVVSES